MIYRIAEPAPGGKGVIGVYPEWDTDGSADARILSRLHPDNLTVLFARNHASAFFARIAPALLQYGHLIDFVCGWQVEHLRMVFLPLNPNVEVLPLSAMNFNTFDLLREARSEASGQEKRFDVFFATSTRPDGLKNTESLGRLLGNVARSLRVVGYGRLEDDELARIAANQNLDFTWNGKAAIADPVARLRFLLDLARSRCLLITSRVEGYCRLIGEALFLGVPVILPAGILCDNWIHLNSNNCRLFVEDLFDICLDVVLRQTWNFPPPEFPEGNALLRQYVEAYLACRKLCLPRLWYPLHYGALTDRRLTEEDVS